MKKLFLLLAFTSIFYFFGCSNDTENNSSDKKQNNELETILLIPSKDGKADESSARLIPKSTTGIFPYFLYKTESCAVPTSDVENNSKLYFNATNTTEEELNLLFGTSSSTNSTRTAENSEETSDESIANLYIIGDLSLTGRYSNSLASNEQTLMFKEMTKNSDGTFSYEFTYDNEMKAWGNGNGNASFKFATINDSNAENNIWYGQTSVFESNTYYIAKPHTTENYDKNILLTALKQGNKYKLVVSTITKDYLVFHLEGALSETPTLLIGPFIRGIPTANESGDWQYVKLSEAEENGYYYDFTYSTNMEDKTTSCSIVFSIMPTNAYSLGSYGGKALSGGGELSSTIASFSTTNTSECNSVTTVYSSQENHNIILENLEDCYKYRINVSNPSAAKIEDNVYTLKFTKLEKDENATAGINFYGLNGWQCRGTFNGWGYDNTDSMLKQVEGKTGEYTFTFTATNESKQFKIAYGNWNRAFSGVSLSASNTTAQTMNTSVEDSTISNLTVGTTYKLTFNCSETTKINNPGTVTVKIDKITIEQEESVSLVDESLIYDEN